MSYNDTESVREDSNTGQEWTLANHEPDLIFLNSQASARTNNLQTSVSPCAAIPVKTCSEISKINTNVNKPKDQINGILSIANTLEPVNLTGLNEVEHDQLFREIELDLDAVSSFCQKSHSNGLERE